jgi:hypothetical protein
LADPVEQVVVAVPRGEQALSAMRVVAGWVASCNDLALDELDDLNLAVETLLMGEGAHGERLSMSIWVMDRTVHALLEGLQSRSLLGNLRQGKSFESSPDWPLDVRLFLGALVDSYEVVECDRGAFRVLLRKRLG